MDELQNKPQAISTPRDDPPADKGNATALMNKDLYDYKIVDLISQHLIQIELDPSWRGYLSKT